MKSIILAFWALALLVICLPAHAAPSEKAGTVIYISQHVSSSNMGNLYIKIEEVTECTNLVVQGDDARRESILSIAMAAQLSARRVFVTYDGCSLISIRLI
jgi:hypothetical protein